MLIVSTGLYGKDLAIVPECIFDAEQECRMYPCCEAQEVKCCLACEHTKCECRCKGKCNV